MSSVGASSIQVTAIAIVSQSDLTAIEGFELRLFSYVSALQRDSVLSISYRSNHSGEIVVEVELSAPNLDGGDIENFLDLFGDSSSPLQLDRESLRKSRRARDSDTAFNEEHCWVLERLSTKDSAATREFSIEMARGVGSMQQVFAALVASPGWTVAISARPCDQPQDALRKLLQDRQQPRLNAENLAVEISKRGLPVEVSLTAYGPEGLPTALLRSALLNLVSCASLSQSIGPRWLSTPAGEALVILRLPFVAGNSLAGIRVVPTQLVRTSHDVLQEGIDNSVRLGAAIDQSARPRSVFVSGVDLDRHLYVPGQTGSGKSTFMRGMAVELAAKGQGFLFIDPHGNTVERLLGELPQSRADDVVFIDASDLTVPAPINPFAVADPLQLDTAMENVVEMFHDLFDPSQQGIVGPRWDTWFRMGMWTLIAAHGENATILDVPSLFNDDAYLEACKRRVESPIVLEFWDKEMAKTTDSTRSEILGWFNSKFTAFRMNSVLNTVLGSGRDALEATATMDSSKIVLVSLAKGEIGEPVTRLLGYVYLTRFWTAALRRKSPSPFTIFVDEAQSFTKGSLPAMLSEGRKFGLRVVLANQYLGQLPDNLRSSVLGNIGSIVALRLGTEDAVHLASRFAPEFSPDALRLMPNFHAAASLLASGKIAPAFSLKIDYEERIPSAGSQRRAAARFRRSSKEHLMRWNSGRQMDARTQRIELIEEVTAERQAKEAALRAAQLDRLRNRDEAGLSDLFGSDPDERSA